MRSPTLRIACTPITLRSPGRASPAGAQQPLPVMGNRDLSLVTSTPGYRLFSDSWVNLQPYLDGEIDLDDAAVAVVAATGGE